MKIAVYCSAKNQIPEEFLRLGDELGKWIAQSGHTLVYGGATGGLMTRVSEAVAQSHGRVIGVIPQCIIGANRQATNCDELLTCENMSQRKQTMRDMADCFVCLPGSYGTLDEMMDVISSGVVGEHHKPLYVLNYQGFYDSLRDLVDHMIALQFIPSAQSYSPIWVENIDELFTLIH